MEQRNSDIDVIQSAGGLIWKDTSTGKKIAIIHRTRYDDWTLPKGKLEPGESWKGAALREVKEEANCEVEIINFAGCTCYTHHETPKVVLFWNMRLIHQNHFEPGKEVDQVQWLSPHEAMAILDYPSERELVKKNI